jgi:hypothetical protein
MFRQRGYLHAFSFTILAFEFLAHVCQSPFLKQLEVKSEKLEVKHAASRRLLIFTRCPIFSLFTSDY